MQSQVDVVAAAMPTLLNQEGRLLFEEYASISKWEHVGSHFPVALSIRHPVSLSHLEHALNRTIAAHPSTRARFEPTDRYNSRDRGMQLTLLMRRGIFVPGFYRQVVTDPLPVRISRRFVTCDEPDLNEIIEAEVDRPLPTSISPVMRATLFTRDVEDHVLVLTMSHLNMDGWSVGVFIRDFSNAYTDAHADVPSCCAAYERFVKDETDLVWNRRAEHSIDYWRRQWELNSESVIRHSMVPFGMLNPRGRLRVGVLTCDLPSEFGDELKRTLRGMRLTPYAFFRTVTLIALSRLIGRTRVGLWANFANRTVDSVDATGWFARSHFLATDVHANTSWPIIAESVSNDMMEASAHARLPLQALWLRLGKTSESDESRIAFDYLPQPRKSPSVFVPIVVPGGRSWMDLSIRVREFGGGFAWTLFYNINRYTGQGVEALSRLLKSTALQMVERTSMTAVELESLIGRPAEH